MKIFTSAPIHKDDETVVFSEKKHKVGASVSIFSVRWLYRVKVTKVKL